MPLIKCPDCGKEISDKAKTCIYCGCPISEPESHLTVYGIRQQFLIGGTAKLYLDGEFVGEIKKRGKFEMPITKEQVLTAKCGINPFAAEMRIKPGKDIKLQIAFERISGKLRFEEVDYVIGANI